MVAVKSHQYSLEIRYREISSLLEATHTVTLTQTLIMISATKKPSIFQYKTCSQIINLVNEPSLNTLIKLYTNVDVSKGKIKHQARAET